MSIFGRLRYIYLATYKQINEISIAKCYCSFANIIIINRKWQRVRVEWWMAKVEWRIARVGWTARVDSS